MCVLIGRSGVEWSGVEWSGVEWSGVEWRCGVEWSGVEWSGVEWMYNENEIYVTLIRVRLVR